MSVAARRALLLAAVLQLVFGLLTFGRWAPVADGTFYHLFATRLASGQGYTMLWPDGVVTYAAHYPVGYSALLAPFYAAFGPNPGIAWLLGASLHLAATAALARMVPRGAGRLGRHAQALAVLAYSLHPALFFYTPALMTEAITADLWVLAVAVLASRLSRPKAAALAGLLLGVATLVRPQSIVVAFGLAVLWWWRLPARRLSPLLLVVPLLVCAPWTARNCVRMHQCALVSVNGGWNLLIGTQTESGAWEPASVPEECREVWDEAAKDRCFGAAAKRTIVGDPLGWLARAPAKASVTFDYFGAAPYTLHEANPALLGERGKLALAVAETTWQRLLWLAAAIGVAAYGHRQKDRALLALGAVAAIGGLLRHGAALTVLLLGVAALLQSTRTRSWPWLATAVVLPATLLLHVVFFGGGRYGLVVVPWVVFAAVGSWTAQGASAVDEVVHGSSSKPANG